MVFLDKVFRFSTRWLYGCHNVLMMFMNLSNIATLKIHGADYCCITSRIIKSNTINLQNIDLTEKSIIL